MIWKHEAMDKLKQYEAKCAALENIPLEIRQLKLDMESIRSADPDSSPVKGSGTSREGMILNNITYREELKESWAQTKHWLDAVNRALNVLTPEERLILDRFYINPEKKAADRLAGDLRVDIKTVYRRKDEALRKFTLALYGVTET